MHYRHSYHAGNFADVFKHTVLCGLLHALNRKDRPWCYLETHAGAGNYDLRGEGAQRTAEWREGIGRLYGLQDAPEPLATCLRVVGDAQPAAAGSPTASPVVYPGSPRFARSLARPGDRLLLCEKVPEIAAALRAEFAGDRQVTLHARNGYEAYSLLPPDEKRGLVLVDPPFERRDEFEACGDLLEQSLRRFAAGIFAVWYPLKNRHEAGRFVRRAARMAVAPCLNLTLENGARGEGQMRACGVLLVNPPHRFDSDIQPALQLLARQLARGPGARCGIERLARATSA